MFVSSEASDAAQNVADSLNPGNISGWDLLAAFIVIVLSVPIARVVKAAIRRALGRMGVTSSEVAADLGLAAKWLVYLLGFAIAASILGVNIGFLSVLFAFALIIGALALKPMIENSASGILLLARPAFSVGDQIQSAEFRGIVEEIGSRATRLRQDDGVVVYVSNNQVLGNPITVYSSLDSRKGSFEIRVRPDTDLDHVTSVLTTAIATADQVVADPPPAIQATALTDNTIVLSVSYWYPSTRQTGGAVADAVIRATMSALSEADIELAVPEVKPTEAPASKSDASAPGDDHHSSQRPAATEDDR